MYRCKQEDFLSYLLIICFFLLQFRGNIFWSCFHLPQPLPDPSHHPIQHHAALCSLSYLLKRENNKNPKKIKKKWQNNNQQMKQKSHKIYIELIVFCPTSPGCGAALEGGDVPPFITHLLLDDALFMNSVPSFINQRLIPMLCSFKSFFCPGSCLECSVSLQRFITLLATTCCLTRVSPAENFKCSIF